MNITKRQLRKIISETIQQNEGRKVVIETGKDIALTIADAITDNEIDEIDETLEDLQAALGFSIMKGMEYVDNEDYPGLTYTDVVYVIKNIINDLKDSLQ